MDLGVFWGFDSLCLWIYAAAGDHASPGWRFITITDKDTWTFSKSWKRMARFQSLQPFCHDCRNSFTHPPCFQLFLLFLLFFQHSPYSMHKHTEAKCPWKASPLKGGGSGNGIWFPVEMEKAHSPLSVLLVRLLGKGGWSLVAAAGGSWLCIKSS